jgi:hypothetical protein
MRAQSAIFAAALFAVAAAEAQQAYSPPRTANGQPDFQGVWVVSFITPFERIEGFPGPTISREQAPELAEKLAAGAPEVIDPDFAFYSLRNFAEVKGELRTAQVIEPADGLLPFTPAGLKQAEEYDRLFMHGFDNPEERDNYERCLAGMLQAPMRPFPAPIPFLFVQTKDHVAIWGEDVNAMRVVHLRAAPPPQAVRSREGFSAGRWEGDTLVVTTTHIIAGDPYRATMGRSVIIGPDSRVIERFTRVSEGTMLYEATIEDLSIYAKPWRAEFPLRFDPKERVYEYACHEGNQSIVNMLLAGRVADKKPKKR